MTAECLDEPGEIRIGQSRAGHTPRIGSLLMDQGWWILNDIVWVKRNPMPQMKGVRFCNAHETLLWVKKSKEQTGYTFHYRGLKGGNDDRQLRSPPDRPDRREKPRCREFRNVDGCARAR